MDQNLFWAKKAKGTDGSAKWLPLCQHLLDTKFVIGMLYNHYLSEHQRQIIENAVDGGNAKKIVEFIGITHDLGKATPAFQMKKSYQGLEDLDEDILEKLFLHGFVPDDYMDLLSSSNRSPHALAGESLLKKFGVNDDVGSIIGGHHGKPIEYEDDCNNINDFSENYYYEINSKNNIHIKWADLQKEIFDWAMDEVGYDGVEDIPSIKSITAQVIIEGLLIMADWIASNDNYFPLFDEDQDTCDYEARMHEGWLKWFGNDSWNPEYNHDSNKYYQENFGFSPREFQDRIFKVIDKSQNLGIMIVEAGMGMGKTEVALSSVEQLSQKSKCNGMFYCLPTQATTNAMFNRVYNWLTKVSARNGDEMDIQLVHGKASLNDKFADLPHNTDIGESLDEGVMVNQWFTGNKTAILDSFVVGTIDQLLLLALRKKHLALRHLGFSGKVVVIDEAHGFDSYMHTYLCRALQWLGKYHIPVVILSATLPAQKRAEFINSYLDKHTKESKIYNDLAYPLVSYSDGNEVKVIDDFAPVKQSTEVSVKPFMGDENDLLNKTKSLLSDGGVCGIVVNTVKRAQLLGRKFIEAFGEENVEVLHASFLDTDRSKKEKKLLSEIGKDKNETRPKLKIVIGTQVLEQSLDIDFDVMFTDLAPIDLILQRVGRLHRHADNNDKRPNKLKNPQLYVLSMNTNYEYESGASFVYGDFLLMRTQYFLPSKINLPNSISNLVQKVYDFSIPIQVDDEINEKYVSAQEDYEVKINSKKVAASTYTLKNYSDMQDSLIGWLNNDSKESSGNNHSYGDEGLAQVRDGEDTIEVIMVKNSSESGYCLIGDSNNDISGIIADGDYNKAKELAQNTIKLPRIFSKSYNIEHTIDILEEFNRKKLATWQLHPFLKGSLGIILDDNNQFKLDDYTLTYDSNIGLMIE